MTPHPSSSLAFLDCNTGDESLLAFGARLFQVDAQQFINWRWQMKAQIRSSKDLPGGFRLYQQEEQGFKNLEEIFNIGISPYYLALIAWLERHNPDKALALRLQALPRQEELQDRRGVKDPMAEIDQSPVPEVVHLYPDRVAFCVAMLCSVYCRYCFRKRREEDEGLHFNRTIIDRGLEYISKTPAIRDVLVTGGDPFIASDTSLEQLVARLRAIPHVEVIRIGTRTPVTLPYRVTPELAKALAKYHPIWINTHFNCAEELTPEARLAISHLVDHGIPVGNQTVLLAGINDTTKQMAELCRQLIRARVRPYYLFHPHAVAGTEHLRLPISRGLQIMKELRGNISGYAIPTYVLDTPSGKIPLGYDAILGRDGDDLLIENIRGEIWREKDGMASLS